MTNLINYPKCGKQISIRAAKCPHCNYIIPQKICPECKEEVNGLLGICQTCGYNFPEAAEKAKQRDADVAKENKLAFMILAVSAIVFLIGLLFY